MGVCVFQCKINNKCTTSVHTLTDGQTSWTPIQSYDQCFLTLSLHLIQSK